MNPDIGLIFLLLVTIIIGWLLGYREATRKRFTRTQDYLKNWFSDESPKASAGTLSELTNVLEFDDESFETFLALGAMYRKQGKLQKAIELHESLIDSPVLHEEHKQLASLELGKDFATSGIQDRAEAIFVEYKSSEYIKIKRLALRELLAIYKKQREWDAAIEVVSQLLGNSQGDAAQVMSGDNSSLNNSSLNKYSAVHYYCEKALIELSESKYADVKHTLKAIEKLKINDSEHYHRVLLLKIKYAATLDDTALANKLAIELLENEPLLLNYIADALPEGKRTDAFNQAVIEQVTASKVEANGRHLDLYTFMFNKALPKLFVQLPDTAQTRITPLIEQGLALNYVCNHCGFKTGVPSWDCPGCMNWYTFKSTFSTQ